MTVTVRPARWHAGALTGVLPAVFMTPKQCRAARMAVGLSAGALGKAAGTKAYVVECFERGDVVPLAFCHALQRVLDAAGAIFMEENGRDLGVRRWK